MTSGVTGDAGRAQMENYDQQMRETAAEYHLSIEDVLSGKETPASPEQKEKIPAKDEKVAAHAKVELDLLEKKYKDTKIAIERSPDPYARMHMEGTRAGLETRIMELAEKNGLNKTDILAQSSGR